MKAVVFFLLVSMVVHAQPECQPRKGLANFFRKMKAGGPVTIVYFGGSITEAGNGWRDQSAQWFRQQYSKAQITAVNAAIGGTGSDLGAFRTQKDVLAHHPDLVFVEFAVNDGGQASERIHQTMEGIVRQVWKANRKTDLCFVYTLSASMADTLLKGRLWSSMRAMEEIAQHYGIPSILFAVPVIEKFKKGELVFKGKLDEFPGKMVFSPDDVHPYPTTGHRLYTEALIRSMEIIKSQTGKHKLIKPFTKDNWEDAHLVTIKPQGNWQVANDSVARQFNKRLPYLLKATEPGSSFSIAFTGRLVGLFDVVGPGCGQYEVWIDDQPAKLYPRFDKYASYWRTHYFCLPAMEPKKHEVVFTVSGEKLNKAALVKQVNDNPQRYAENACYAGWIMVLGKETN